MVVVEDGVPRHFISGEDSGDLDETMTSTNNHPSDGNRYEQHQQHGSVIAGSGGTRRYRERVARIILLWANNHFSDFESNIEMMRLLDEFEQVFIVLLVIGSESIRFVENILFLKIFFKVLARQNKGESFQFI